MARERVTQQAQRHASKPPKAKRAKLQTVEGEGKPKVDDILRLYHDKLKESGVEKVAKTLRYAPLPAKEVKRLHRAFREQAAIRIPYFDPDGKPTRFYRLRYLGKAPGFAGQETKPQRYAQEPDTLNEVYMPPLLQHSWREVLADPKIPIIFTEGEFKAACGCSHGFPVIGLGGVDVFRSGKRQMSDLLPVLDEASWENREVWIVWDSDVAVKEGPIKAQRALAYRLLKRGALPRLLGLPAAKDGAKVGLDDYLVAHTDEEFQALLDGAPLYEEAAQLWELNEECVFVMDPPLVIARREEKDSDLYMSPVNFVNNQYANRVAIVDGTPKPVAKLWLQWPKRFQVDKLVYAPGQERIVNNQWNAWRGWGTEAKPGNIKPWAALLDFLFQHEDRAARTWFEQWLAYPLQNPGAKLLSACLFWGVEGSGKTFVGEIMRDIYGRHNSSKINSQMLHGAFNKWAWNKQFILAEEVTGSDKRADADHLKDLVTQETITINEKYLPEITLADCANYYMTSNHANALYLGDTDRRYFIVHVTEKNTPAFYHEIDVWRKAGGAAHVRYYLQNLDLEGFNPKGQAYRTAAKEDMISDSRSEIQRWVYELKENTPRVLAGIGVAKVSTECDLLTPTQLFKLYNPENDQRLGTVNGLSRELRGANVFKACRGKKIMTRAGVQTFFILRNRERWIDADGKACAAHWERFFMANKF